MDLTGLKAYHAVMKDLFPELSNKTTVPKLIDDIAKKGGNGISNGVGFYKYSKEEAQKWESAFERFSFDINKVSLKYSKRHLKFENMAPKQLFTVDGHLDLATNAMTLNRDLTKDVKEIRILKSHWDSRISRPRQGHRFLPELRKEI